MQSPQHYRPSAIEDHVWLLQVSFTNRFGKKMIPGKRTPTSVMHALNEANFAVVSHGTEEDPIFNYANPKALELFEMDFDQFTNLPSRKSAEVPNREERQRLLEAVSKQGYIDDYKGIRISATGRRFYIQQAFVWNLHNENGEYCGQAAMIPSWQYLEESQQQAQQQQQ